MSQSAPPVGDRSDREDGEKIIGSASPLCLRGNDALKGASRPRWSLRRLVLLVAAKWAHSRPAAVGPSSDES